MKETEMRNKWLTLIVIILGNVVYALAVKLFLLPTDLIMGGTTGISLIMNHFFHIPISAFVLVFNVAMLIVGWIVMGKKFALTTILSTFAYPIALEFWNRLLGDLVLTQDIWLNTLFAGIGIGVGLGMVIRFGASTGGMEIPPLVLNHYFRIPVSVAMYVFDFVILIFQMLYSPIENLLYGIVLTLVYTIVLDKLMMMGTTRTEVKIVSQKHEEIRTAILQDIDRGVTMLTAQTGYLGQETEMIFSVVSNREVAKLERIVHNIDPLSFMVVSRVSEVRGRGFTAKKDYKNGALNSHDYDKISDKPDPGKHSKNPAATDAKYPDVFP